MIPVKLVLHNFMSYAEAELSFQGIHTACLTGNNGNGKSALLDAITWALWGQARGVEKNGAGMDDLVRLGCEEMAVEFTFEMDQRLYRVIRKRDKRRQLSALELQLQAGESFRSLTGDKLAQTQEKIFQVLKMDYETFTNSAFILQGKADSFTTQKASDRKRILGEILGLSYYDRLERKARDKMNQEEARVKELERLLQQAEEELAQEASTRMELEKAKSAKLAVDSTLGGLEQKLETLAGRLAQLQALERQREELRAAVAQRREQAGQLQQQADFLARKIAGLREILAREEEIAAGYKRLHLVQAAEEETSRKQARAMELIQKQNQLEKLIAAEKAKLLSELARLESRKTQLAKSLTRAEAAQGEIADLEKQLQDLENSELVRMELQKEIHRLKGEKAEKEGTLKALNQELALLRERFKTLQYSEAQCPLCNSPLTVEKKEQLLAEFTAAGKDKRKEQEQLTKDIPRLANLIQETEAKLNAYPSDRRSQVESKLELARRDIAEGEQALEAMAELSAQESELRILLEQEMFSPAMHTELKRLHQEQRELAYNPEEHQNLREEQKKLLVFAEQYVALEKAKVNLPEEEKLLQQLITQREREFAEAAKQQESISLLDTQLVKLRDIVQEHNRVKQEVIRLRDEKSRMEVKLGALEQKMARLAQVKEQKRMNLALREEVARKKQLYAQLVMAFSKKGIQAMIIENAIPELQEEANNLLARMTDGKMHLTLLTQRDTKKGSVTETLDIRIADELGTRKYEMFSGGEAFRVNFALRIALSKLLARRAGAKLQTLVIDEGFGTQDGSGKERLIEIINAIKDDFAKILIITHVQELKDAFPVQIEVDKTAGGSCLRLV